MADPRGALNADPFSFVVRDDRVRIARGGKTVTTLGAQASARFLRRATDADEAELQQLMARATGNYRRGNERRRRR